LQSDADMDSIRKLKVLVVVGEFPAISNPFIFNQITGLIDLGHDVSIFAMEVVDQQCEHAEVEEYQLREKLYVLDEKETKKWDKIKYVVKYGIPLIIRKPRVILSALKVSLTGSYPLSFDVFRYINSVAKITKSDFDIIHAQFGPYGNTMMMVKEFGVSTGKLVTAFRGFDVSRVIRSEGEHYYDSLFASGDLFLPVCDDIRSKVIRLGAPEDKTFVHYSAINLDKFVYKKRDFEKSGALRIGSVGRLTAKKGYEYVIQALSVLKDEGFDFTYKIVGDGELKNDVVNLVSRCGLSDNVELLGSRNHDYIVNFLNNIDIFISHNITAESGDQEGIPNTIKEAMLSGVPVFTTYHGGITELVSDEVNGFLTDEKNVQQLLNKLKSFAFPLQNLENITENARETAVSMFDADKLNNELVDRYHSLFQ
jgi:colanic acid/amylovoran biosynthesis glycosyltransferase